MKKIFVVIGVLLMAASCNKKEVSKSIFVKNIKELNNAITNVKQGEEIVLANGIWKNAEIKFFALGAKDAPITLRAETPGKVFIEGKSSLHLGGQYLVVDGLYFRNGYSPENGVIRFMINTDSIAHNTRVTNTVIDGFTRPNKWENDRWIEFYGRHNQLDHSYIAGKSNDGETLRVFFTGNENIKNHHQIIHNYFGPRPRKGGPRAETIRVGDSKTRFAPGYVNVSNNYFEACNGEVEIISDKTNYNSFTNNIFYKCEGSLVLRHSNYATVNANIFIGGDDSNFYGGIRAVNTGHWITNNYFYKIKGEEFRSPLAVMNGIPMTPLNRYKQVADVVVAYNTWVDCKSPWQIGVGQNTASAGVLPPSEVRSAAPIRSIIANNIIYNTKEDAAPVVNHDKMDGILFKNNILDNNGKAFTEFGVLKNETIKMKQINNWLFVPEDTQNDSLNEVYYGFDFKLITADLFGVDRSKSNKIGAAITIAAAKNFRINKKNYGPDWFSTESKNVAPNILTASSKKGELAKIIAEAKSGDIIHLTDTLYTINTALSINKDVTISSKRENKVQLLFTGDSNTSAFKMHPKGSLHLNNLSITSKTKQLAFAPLKENMASAYKLYINNCMLSNFKYVLQATKGSFADTINIQNTTIKNCENGIVLTAEEKGDYNAEMVTINKCTFKNIDKNVLYFYRGGYDESTIGGNLKVTNSVFENCGSKEKSGTMLKTPGIINVTLMGNTFQNNPVKLVALLWGEKNNHHSTNKVLNSGLIKVEEQHKLDILY